jgi:hypothetical protein
VAAVAADLVASAMIEDAVFRVALSFPKRGSAGGPEYAFG